MRLSALLLAGSLLIPPTLLAQHNPAPTPTPAPPAPVASPAMHASPPTPPLTPAQPPSMPSHSSASPEFPANSPGSTSWHSSPKPSEASPVHPSSETTKVETTKSWEPIPKKTEPSNAHVVCEGALCAHQERVPTPKPIEGAHLQPCKGQTCRACITGYTADKNGECMASPPASPKAAAVPTSCTSPQVWNGATCVAPGTQACMAGFVRQGVECVDLTSLCATFNSRASLLAIDVDSIDSEKQAECTKNPQSQRCVELSAQLSSAHLSYDMLRNEAPVDCRSLLPRPASL
jgi:hypothetical protein